MVQKKKTDWAKMIHWRRNRLPTPVFLGFPCGSDGKESTCNVEDLGSIPGLGRSLGEGKGYPVQYSGLEISMDIVHGVTESWMWLSDFFHFSLGVQCSAPHLLPNPASGPGSSAENSSSWNSGVWKGGHPLAHYLLHACGGSVLFHW